jgi:hypothetical protein
MSNKAILFPTTAIDKSTGRTVRVSKSGDVRRSAFPVTLQQFREDGTRWGAFGVGNTLDAWTSIKHLAKEGRITQEEATALLADADKADSNLRHRGNGNWIETA